MLAEHAERVCHLDTKVDIHGVRPGTYPEGVAPIEALRYPWFRHLLDLQVIENAVRAEREGYDAMAISCFYDPGLEAARGSVDIPVASICESTLLVAKSVGRSLALVGLEEDNAAFLRDLVHHYGLQDLLACVVALDPPVTEPELDRAFAGSSEFVRRFEESCRRQVTSAGADVLVPAEGVLNTALVRNGVQKVDGRPVIDAYAILLAHTEMLVQLRHTTGMEVSRIAYGPRPPDSLVAHFRGVAHTVLAEAQAEEPVS
jgi:Asp/Glu/hydantoin racemase